MSDLGFELQHDRALLRLESKPRQRRSERRALLGVARGRARAARVG